RALSTAPPTSLLLSMFRPPPSATLFPYTTLFRSHRLGPATAVEAAAVPAAPLGGHDGAVGEQRRGEGRGREHQRGADAQDARHRSEEHTSELQSRENLVCRLLLEKKKTNRAPTGP